MNSIWAMPSQLSTTEESDILGPEEYQDVMAANPALLESVFNGSEDLCYQYQEDQEQKLYISTQYPIADSTFATNCFTQSTGPLPAREDYPGPYHFSVLLDGSPVSRNKWAYSKCLNKLYIVWQKVIPIQFKWIPQEPGFVVRALPVYTDPQDMKDPVLRCVLHSRRDCETNDGFEHIHHVIRSENTGAIYEENPQSKRCSVKVPLGEPQPGTGAVTVTYKFMCKTTCSLGMMRRPITVLFTLERSNGEVVGRQKLSVKICSCPSRDMKKDEASIVEGSDNGNGTARRSLSLMEKNVAHRLSKRVKMESENEMRTLLIRFEDREIFSKMLEFNHAAATSLLRRTPRNHSSFTALNDFLDTVESKMSDPDY